METGIHQLTAAYALDALDPEERRAYESHLETCETCRAELASFADVTGALAVAASGSAPPPGLRERMLEAARAEPQVVVPLEARRRRTTPVLAAAAAIAAILALAVGLRAASLSSELDETRSVLDVLVHPEARTVALEQGDGSLVVDPDGRAVLVLHDVGPAPSGKTYEMWIIEGKTPVSAGLFRGGDATDVESLSGRVTAGDVVAVTIEKAGGVEAPTTQPIVASDPV